MLGKLAINVERRIAEYNIENVSQGEEAVRFDYDNPYSKFLFHEVSDAIEAGGDPDENYLYGKFVIKTLAEEFE